MLVIWNILLKQSSLQYTIPCKNPSKIFLNITWRIANVLSWSCHLFVYFYWIICFSSRNNKSTSIYTNTRIFQFVWCWRKIEKFQFFVCGSIRFFEWLLFLELKTCYRFVSDRVQVYCQIWLVWYIIVFYKSCSLLMY